MSGGTPGRRRLLPAACLLALAGLLAGTPAHAQNQAPADGGAAANDQLDEKIRELIPEALAREALQQALRTIRPELCQGDDMCRLASAEEFANPPLTPDDARAAIYFAMRSAATQWCGLDYKRSYLPMLVYGKHRRKMTDRELFLLSLIHGEFMGEQVSKYVESGQDCPPELRERIDSTFPRLPESGVVE
ncbi:hypothetical protein [Oceanibacterium hippocampi]|uniref:Uncharacterized protein n=1 Tax=Oceanibacterium hippocampi TaxID=745714 RepID=A0A1Y5SRL9_9PROT|nr:hypothetical protein [Oceanibacterium hippocampi]SLN43671.1 hypothetical protein OCH7691_01825 [Oceanibacterium hippocampi]